MDNVFAPNTYRTVTTITQITLMGNWNKPASWAYFDNLRWTNGFGGGGGLQVSNGTFCTSISGANYAVGTEAPARKFIYNPTNAYMQISCPIQNPDIGPYPNSSFVQPERWEVEDNYSTDTANDFAVYAQFARNGGLTATSYFADVNQDYPGQPTQYLDYPTWGVNRMFSISDRSVTTMIGNLPPMKNGKASKLYYYTWRTY